MNTACEPVPPRLRTATGNWLWIAVLEFSAAAGVALFWFDPAHYSFYPFCIFHRTTGLLCPGCGALRATHQLLHGQVAAALHFNALFVLMLPVAGWFAARFVLGRLRNQPQAPAIRPAWLWCGLAATILFGVLRNLPFAQVAWLAP
jgi:hypothetical protein